MALSRDDAERLANLQRQLELRAQLETERALFRLARVINDFTQETAPLRRRFINAMVSGDMDRAERLERELERDATRWLREVFAKEERQVIREVIRNAAMRGAQTVDLAPALAASDRRSLDALLNVLASGSIGGGATGRIGAQYGVISSAVQRQIERKVYKDGLNLSRRLHVRLIQREAEFKRILSQGLKQGQDAISLAKHIQTLDVTDARLPKYLRDLERVLKGTKDAALVDEIRRAAEEAAKRKKGPLGMQGPAKRVVQAARTGSADALDGAIEYFLERKVRYHSLVIARTEANNAFLAGHIEQAKETPWVIGVKWHLSGSHSRECECEELARQDRYGLGPGVYPPDKVPDRPHPMCVVGGTIVSGPRPVASMTRWYEGEVVDIHTVGGHHLTVTPNHPILTPQGWVPAGLLSEGDDVVCGSRLERDLTALTSPFVDPDDYQVPSLIEDVAGSLGQSRGVVPISVPVAPEHFHGDGVGSDICVVRTDGLSEQRLGGERESLNRFLGAHAGEISLDRITKLRVRDFAGHVYNLQTKTGWYLANGIVTHNCMCFHTDVVDLRRLREVV